MLLKIIFLHHFLILFAHGRFSKPLPSDDCIIRSNLCQCYNKETDQAEIVIHCKNLENTSVLGNLTSDLWGEQLLVNAITSKGPRYSDLVITNSDLPNISHPVLTNNICYFKSLNLSHNSILHVVPNTFYCNMSEQLEEIDFSNNNLTEISGWFFRSPNLKRFYLQRNNIVSIRANAWTYLSHLQSLNISFNKLAVIKNNTFHNLSLLQLLTVAHNNISVIESGALLPLTSLTSLDLSCNCLHNLDAFIFLQLPKLSQLSLAHNKLVILEAKNFIVPDNLRELHIEGNPWACNDSMMWLYDSLQVTQVDLSPNKVSVLCFSPDDLQNKTVHNWTTVKSMEKSFERIGTCQICNCSVDREKILAVVDCQGKGLTHLPELLPNNTKIVHMENNNIKSLTTNTDFLDEWQNVMYLYLNNNTIESLKGIEGTRLVQNLALLQLTRNRLKNIPVHILDQFSETLHDLYLGDNPWDCDCNTVRFQNWLRYHYKQVRDIEKIHCGAADGMSNSGKAIYKLMKSDLCPQAAEGVNYLDILNVVMAVLIVTILSKLILDYWWQKRTGKLPHFFSFRLH